MKRMNLKNKGLVAVAVVMSFMVFAVPILAQQGDLMAGSVAGEQSARSNVNGSLWFLAGCFGGLLGVIVAYVYEPSPPSVMLLGKSPEYVAAYTDAYRSTAKRIQSGKAWTGCIVGTLVNVASYMVLVALEESTY